MWSYIARRLLFVVPTLLGVSIIMFSLLHVVPGDPLAGLLPLQSGPAEREQLARELGFDKPVVVQYGKWLSKAVRGDLGRSLTTSRPIAPQVLFALKNTFLLAITAGVLSMFLGVILGTIAGFHQGRWPDKVASAIAITGLSLPNYWVAIILIIVFAAVFRVLPSQGMSTIGGAGSGGALDVMKHMAIPVVALMMISLGIITRMVRTSVLEVLNQEYVTALRAKGLMPLKVVIHVIKNAAPPVVTVVGLDIGYLLGGSILVESVVNWPGAGGLVNYAIQQRDITLIQGTVLILSSFFVIINVIVDFLNTVIDPRIRRT